MEKELDNKLKDTSIDGAAISLEPSEADELGAISDDMPLQDVIDAAFDNEA